MRARASFKSVVVGRLPFGTNVLVAAERRLQRGAMRSLVVKPGLGWVSSTMLAFADGHTSHDATLKQHQRALAALRRQRLDKLKRIDRYTAELKRLDEQEALVAKLVLDGLTRRAHHAVSRAPRPKTRDDLFVATRRQNTLDKAVADADWLDLTTPDDGILIGDDLSKSRTRSTSRSGASSSSRRTKRSSRGLLSSKTTRSSSSRRRSSSFDKALYEDPDDQDPLFATNSSSMRRRSSL